MCGGEGSLLMAEHSAPPHPRSEGGMTLDWEEVMKVLGCEPYGRGVWSQLVRASPFPNAIMGA